MIRIPRMFNTDKKPAGDGDGGCNDTMFKTKPRPRLERRNAIRNIDYELPSVSSSAFSDDCLLSSTSASTPSSSPAQRTRSLDIYPLDKHMSFRIQGNCPGEFEIICRSLGLSGPEDFAIPAAAWENMKVRSSSSSDVFPRLSKFNYGDAITRKIENAVSKDNSSRITSDSVCPPTPSVNDAINRKINNSGSNASRVSDFVCTPSVNDSIDQKLGNADSKDSDFVCTRGVNDAINQKIKNAGSKDKASKVSDFVSTPNLNDAFNRKIEIAGSKDNSSRVSDFVCTPSVNDVINRNTEGSGLRVLEVVATPVRSSSVSVRSVRSHNRLRYNHDEVLIENVEGSDVDSNHCENSDYSRIEGIRPPELAHPPAMSLHHVDSVCSTWDILKSFAPDDDDRGSSRSDRSQDEVCIKRDEDEDGEEKDVDHVVESRRANNEESGLLSESCSFATTSNDDDSSSTTLEPFSNISPYGRFRRTISYWEKGELLGRGSFGSVYEGIADGGFFFAVKEVSLLDQGETAKQSIYQLEQEIALLSRFEHDNIVQYYGTDKDESKLYIFLELVTKGSLLSLYRKYHLQDSQVSAYTRQILHGLQYLHDQNVVHRDIKCANILVDARGSVKLADFGLAKATKLNDVKSCKGTVLWMAPEVVNRRNQGYGLAADIWSLGCTVLEMLTGQFPYTHLEPMAALFRIGKGELPRVPESLSRDARDFILQCLQVNPNSRPAAAQLLDHPFVQRSLPSSGSTSPYFPNRRA